MGRHDIEVRKRAAELIDSGFGRKALANALAISASIAEHWIHAYKAVGKEVFLDMGSKHRTYDQETKLAAVLDFLGGGLTKQEAMTKHAIASLTAFESWVGDTGRVAPTRSRPSRRAGPAPTTGRRGPPPAKRSWRRRTAGSRPRWRT